MTEPEYTVETDGVSITLAVYIHHGSGCNREWYDDSSSGEPEFCPYCGEELDD